MKPILLLLILIAVPVSGWAEDVIFEDISVHEWMPAVCCTPSEIYNCVECNKPSEIQDGCDYFSGACIPIEVKSKRQELIEKCENYLEKSRTATCDSWYGDYVQCNANIRSSYAQIATAYCLRASLEDKQ